MTPVEICFWVAAAGLLYPYLIYPLLAGVLARLGGRPVHLTGPAPRSVSVVVAAHNEETNVVRRLDEMTALLHAASLDGEVIVVSDGSTDGTAAAARATAIRGCASWSWRNGWARRPRCPKAAPPRSMESLSLPTCARPGRRTPCRGCWRTSPTRPSAPSAAT